MDFDIKPFIGAGPILFGMSQQEILNLQLGTVRSFKRTPLQQLPSDHFIDIGLVIYYKHPGVVEAIEFSRPSNPIFSGVSLFNQTVEQFQCLLASKDKNLKIEEDGCVSYACGIGAYILAGEEEGGDHEKIVSVIVFERGYYD